MLTRSDADQVLAASLAPFSSSRMSRKSSQSKRRIVTGPFLMYVADAAVSLPTANVLRSFQAAAARSDDPERLSVVQHDAFLWEAYTQVEELGLLKDVPVRSWDERTSSARMRPTRNLWALLQPNRTRISSSLRSCRIHDTATNCSCSSWQRRRLERCGCGSSDGSKWDFLGLIPSGRCVSITLKPVTELD